MYVKCAGEYMRCEEIVGERDERGAYTEVPCRRRVCSNPKRSTRDIYIDRKRRKYMFMVRGGMYHTTPTNERDRDSVPLWRGVFFIEKKRRERKTKRYIYETMLRQCVP